MAVRIKPNNAHVIKHNGGKIDAIDAHQVNDIKTMGHSRIASVASTIANVIISS